MASVAFTVYGKAAPAGSKRGFYNAKARRVIISDDSSKSRPWKALVSDAAEQAMSLTRGSGEYELLDGPLALVLTFYVPRPKAHIGVRGVKASAPPYPAVKPDLLKLTRAIEDALTGIVYRDDAQIVRETLAKRYGEPARCEVLIGEISAIEEAAKSEAAVA